MIRIRTIASVLLPVALCVLLLCTMYFTPLEWQWVTFLAGIFLAAVLAQASRAASNEWRIARRTAEIRVLKKSLALEANRSRQAEHRLAEAEMRATLTPDAEDELAGFANPLEGGLPATIPEVSLAAIADVTGYDHYFQSMSDELTGWEDPRQRFVEALENDQFTLLCQAIVPASADTGGPRYCEVLVRMQEEEQKFMPPGVFFPVAEHYHLMPALDRWVVRHLLRWYGAGRHAASPPQFCINLAADTIADVSFPQFVMDEIDANRVPAAALCFEIAEADVIASPQAAIRFSKAVSNAGCQVTIDGFGGSSMSFGYLQGMSVNLLKIDGSIIGNLCRDQVSLAKTRAIITAAHLSNRKTIAEFVENDETLEKLRYLGVDYVQGFGIARPKPLAELEYAAGPALTASSQPRKSA
jgi:EAL domain-containing protein (putative c-di-GMP-specific phosphodiesterase class I)